MAQASRDEIFPHERNDVDQLTMSEEPSTPPFQLFTSVRYDESLCTVQHCTAFAHAGWNYRQLSPYYMLDFHRDRLLRAATHWQWDFAIGAIAGDTGLARIQKVLDEAIVLTTQSDNGTPFSPQRCRVTLDRDGQLAGSAATTTDSPLAGLFPPILPPPGYMTADPTAAATAAGSDIAATSPNTAALCQLLRTALSPIPWDVMVDMDASSASAYTHYKTTRRQVYDTARQRAGITAAAIAQGQRREILLVNAASGSVMDGSICTVYLWRGGRWVTPPVPARYSEDTETKSSGGLDGTTRRWSLERGLAVEEDIKADSLRDGEECWLSNGVRGFLYGRICLRPVKQAS